MTHIEAFEAVLRNHGYNYRSLSLENGMPENYIYKRIHTREEGLITKVYCANLALMGAGLIAVRGNEVRSLDELFANENERNGTRLYICRTLLEWGGWRLCVKDGEELHYLT